MKGRVFYKKNIGALLTAIFVCIFLFGGFAVYFNLSQRKEEITAGELSLQMAEGKVKKVVLAGKNITASGSRSGFYLRDAGGSGREFPAAECGSSGLSLTSNITASEESIEVWGTVTDLTGATGRALDVTFILPVNAYGKTWTSDISDAKTVRAGEIYTERYLSGSGGSYSNISALCDGNNGIAMAASLDFPQYWSFRYDRGREYSITFRLGIAPECPQNARFAFSIYSFSDGDHGYRAALKKYSELRPDYYEVLAKEQGQWDFFCDLSHINDLEDFNFRFVEDPQNPESPFWDENRLLKFVYYELGDWWIPNTTAATESELRQKIAALAAEGNKQALAALYASSLNADGGITFNAADVPWSPNGVQVHVNSSPYLPYEYNFFNIYHDGYYASPYTGGVYLDCLGGWSAGNYNYNKEHFKYAIVPLSYNESAPVLLRYSSTWEAVEYLSRELHSVGRLLFANAGLDNNLFNMPYADIFGIEMTAQSSSRKYSPPDTEWFLKQRAAAYKKPLCLLLSNYYSEFGYEEMRLFLERSLHFGMFASPSDNYDTPGNRYYQAVNAEYYERDRELFKKYAPVTKAAAEAGWEPLTYARAEGLLTERYGSGGKFYISFYNDSAKIRSSRAVFSLERLGLTESAKVKNAVTGESYRVCGGELDICLDSYSCLFLEITA